MNTLGGALAQPASWTAITIPNIEAGSRRIGVRGYGQKMAMILAPGAGVNIVTRCNPIDADTPMASEKQSESANKRKWRNGIIICVNLRASEDERLIRQTSPVR